MTKSNFVVRGAAVAAVLAVGLAGPAMAAKKNNGPQASVFATTVCSLSEEDGTKLDVAARLNNTSTGTSTPNVLSSTFTGLAKTATGNWSGQQTFDMADGEFTGPVPDFQEIKVQLNLCRLIDPKYILDATKGVNVSATINYDSDGDGNMKTVENMCSDDPATEAIEPNGIAFTDVERAAIAKACGY